MPHPPERQNGGQFGSRLVTAAFVVAGAVTLYDTTGYTDRDSQVFPQAVALILIFTAGLSLIQQFLRPETSTDYGFGRGVWWRRIVLIAGLFLACFLMPAIGFLAAGGLAFALGLLAAMHDRWTTGTALIYGCSGAVILGGFYGLFKFLLKVPLP